MYFKGSHVQITSLKEPKDLIRSEYQHVCSPLKREKPLSGMMPCIRWTTLHSRLQIHVLWCVTFAKIIKGLMDLWQPYVRLKFLKHFQVTHNSNISGRTGQNVFGNHCPHGRAKMVLPVFIETLLFKLNSLKEELMVQARLVPSCKVRVISFAQSGIITIKYFWYLYNRTDNRWWQASNLPQIGPKIGF